MPTYEYVCSKCGHAFEKFQSMKDEALKTCPQELCGMKRWGKGRIQRQVGAGAGLIFKGSGFYITDYRSEGYKAAAKKDSAAGSDPKAAPAKSEAKTESKAEPKAAPKSETKPAAKPAAAPAKHK